METLIVFIVSAMLHTVSIIEIGELQDRLNLLENKPVKTESNIIISGEPIKYTKEIL